MQVLVIKERLFQIFQNGWSEAKYKIIGYNNSTEKYFLYYWNDDGSYFNTKDINTGFHNWLYIPGRYEFYRFNPLEGSAWTNYYTANGGAIIGWKDYPAENAKNNSEMIYSNFTIYKDNTKDVFFYKTPLLNFTTMQRAIGGTLWQVLMKALTILVPIGLTIFGAFCVLFLIKSKKWLPVKPSL